MRTRKRDGWGLPHIFSTKQLENMDNFSAFEPHSIALLKLDANLAALKRKQKRKIINPLETETCSNFLKHTSKRESMPVRHSDDRTGKLLQKVLAE